MNFNFAAAFLAVGTVLAFIGILAWLDAHLEEIKEKSPNP